MRSIDRAAKLTRASVVQQSRPDETEAEYRDRMIDKGDYLRDRQKDERAERSGENDCPKCHARLVAGDCEACRAAVDAEDLCHCGQMLVGGECPVCETQQRKKTDDLFQKARAAVESLPCDVLSITISIEYGPAVHIRIERVDFERLFAGREVISSEFELQRDSAEMVTICCRQPASPRRADETITLPKIDKAAQHESRV